VSIGLLCLAGALVVWPTPGHRDRLTGLCRPRRRTEMRRDRLTSPAPVGVAVLAVAAVLSTPVVALLAGICAALAARGWRSARRATRQQAALAGLADGLAAFAAELRAGRPADDAVRSAAAACGDQDGGARLVRAVRGPPGPDGPSSDDVSAALERMSAAVVLSSRTGCSLAEVVGAVEDDLRARLRAGQELRSATAAPRAGAALLAALPLLGLAMGAGVGADPWGELTTTAVGQVLLVTGVGLEIAGVVWAGRLVRQAVR
jgi:tight adherence protein B